LPFVDELASDAKSRPGGWKSIEPTLPGVQLRFFVPRPACRYSIKRKVPR